MEVTIYHNPSCGTSRNVLALIRNAGIEPNIIEYLNTPPTRDELKGLIFASGLTTREILREKGTPYHELGLENLDLSEGQLLDAMIEYPILINRPIIVTPLGTRLCRPSEIALEILPHTHKGAFNKEDGTHVLDEKGNTIV